VHVPVQLELISVAEAGSAVARCRGAGQSVLTGIDQEEYVDMVSRQLEHGARLLARVVALAALAAVEQ